MADINAGISLIERQFITQWAASAYSSVPVDYLSNEKFNAPPGPWARLTVNLLTAQTIAINPYVRHFGLITVGVFVPQDIGRRYAIKVRDAVAPGLQHKCFTDDVAKVTVITRECGVIYRGIDNGWRYSAIEIPFHIDELD